MRVLSLTLLAACMGPIDGGSEHWSPAPDGLLLPPPGEIVLDVPDLVPGELATIGVTGAEPDATVALMRGSAVGDPLCRGAYCVDLVRPRIIDWATADELGTTTFEVTLSADLPLGTTAVLQAIDEVAGSSNVAENRVVPIERLADWTLTDVNDTSPTFEEPVSPRDYLAKVSGWYFGHAT